MNKYPISQKLDHTFAKLWDNFFDEKQAVNQRAIANLRYDLKNIIFNLQLLIHYEVNMSAALMANLETLE